jgi:hypothetical protein
MLRNWEQAPGSCRRADLLRGDFGWLLTEVIRRSRRGSPIPTPARRSAPARVHSPDSAVDRWRSIPDGQALAWAGNSTKRRRAFALPGPGPSFLVAGGAETPRLFATAIDGLTGLRRVAELVIGSPAPVQGSTKRAEVRIDFVPHWNAIEPADLHLLSDPAGGDELAPLFALQGTGTSGARGDRRC